VGLFRLTLRVDQWSALTRVVMVVPTVLLAQDPASMVGIGLDEAAIHRQVVPFYQFRFEAACHDPFKQLLEQPLTAHSIWRLGTYPGWWNREYS